MTEAPNILLPAIRQYMHNDGSGLVFGFDYEETIDIVKRQREKIIDEISMYLVKEHGGVNASDAEFVGKLIEGENNDS